MVEQEGGWCGMVVIAESHLAVHTRQRQVWVDIFSCIGFRQDTEVVVQAVVRLLSLTQHRATVLERAMPPLGAKNAWPVGVKMGLGTEKPAETPRIEASAHVVSE